MNLLQEKKEIMGNPNPDWVNSKLGVATLIAIHTGTLTECKLKKIAGTPNELQKFQKLDSCINCDTIVRIYKSYFCPACWEFLGARKLVDLMSPYVCTGPDDFEAKEALQKKLISCASKQVANVHEGRKIKHSFSWNARRSKLYKTANAMALFITERGELVSNIDENLTTLIEGLYMLDIDEEEPELFTFDVNGEEVLEEKEKSKEKKDRKVDPDLPTTVPDDSVFEVLEKPTVFFTINLSPTSAKTAPMLFEGRLWDTYDDIGARPYDDLDLTLASSNGPLIYPL